MENVGIYRIQIGPYYYLGQSADLKRREKAHLYRLKKGKHTNPKMQAVWEKYQDFSFKVMIECDIDQLNHLEQSALDIHYGYDDCMNIAKDAQASRRGMTHSEESKRKMSEAQKGKRKGKENTFYGKHHSEDTKRKISEANQDKTLRTFIHEEHGQITCTRHELYTKYNLHKSPVSRLILGKLKSHKGWRLK